MSTLTGGNNTSDLVEEEDVIDSIGKTSTGIP